MLNNEVVGAIWTRKLNKEHNSNGFMDENTPVLNIAVKPEFRKQGIGSAMIEQFLLEAGELYEQISISVLDNPNTIKFFQKHGFEKVENTDKKSHIDESKVFIMSKKLEVKEVQRPTDGYDPTRWMD